MLFYLRKVAVVVKILILRAYNIKYLSKWKSVFLSMDKT